MSSIAHVSLDRTAPPEPTISIPVAPPGALLPCPQAGVNADTSRATRLSRQSFGFPL